MQLAYPKNAVADKNVSKMHPILQHAVNAKLITAILNLRIKLLLSLVFLCIFDEYDMVLVSQFVHQFHHGKCLLTYIIPPISILIKNQ